MQNLDKRRLHFEKSIRDHKRTTWWSAIKQKEEMAQKRIQEEIKEIDDHVLEIRRVVNGLKRLNVKMHYKGRGTFVNQQWKHTELCDNLCNKKPVTTIC